MVVSKKDTGMYQLPHNLNMKRKGRDCALGVSIYLWKIKILPVKRYILAKETLVSVWKATRHVWLPQCNYSPV
ncbi:hypothetical protein H5410_033176 [Solanum commersonii]|uniref:Uncharacterized protein n=1 Tax=Solanum commersonii TaxID=4109 RepID=A0A9J5YSB4_SOLCO|nr:hypothetical protein H5410_033176 [Solanum commersonii]